MLYVNVKVKNCQEEVGMRNKVREVRELKGINQRDLSEVAHTPQSIVSALERGVLSPWPKVMERLSKALGLPINEIFPDDFKK